MTGVYSHALTFYVLISRAQMDRMRHEAEESERIRKELQEKLKFMQEEQERTNRGEVLFYKKSCIVV